MAYAKADENADVEMIKANLEHNEAEKKVKGSDKVKFSFFFIALYNEASCLS